MGNLDFPTGTIILLVAAITVCLGLVIVTPLFNPVSTETKTITVEEKYVSTVEYEDTYKVIDTEGMLYSIDGADEWGSIKRGSSYFVEVGTYSTGFRPTYKILSISKLTGTSP